ncbi:hypothetical protein [Fischerella thermalis]|uniref:hypothetical protein n=1 Tax=Fischerella thermalis TaxID=372787 RepID=UPI0021558E54|nr:hypothetical protein [Fischerella thermalis]
MILFSLLIEKLNSWHSWHLGGSLFIPILCNALEKKYDVAEIGHELCLSTFCRDVAMLRLVTPVNGKFIF